MKELQKRLIKGLKIEVRENTENEMVIEGVIPYDSPSERMYLGYCTAEREVITPTAWNKTLADKRNIFLNYNHNSDLILGATKSGTLEVENKEDGLHWKSYLPNTDIGIRAYQTIKRGDVTTLSFEFYPVEWKVENDISYVTSGRLEAISVCVSNPAYTSTNCQARNLVQKLAEINQTINKKEIEEMDKEEIKGLKELLVAILEKLPKDEEEKTEPVPTESERADEDKKEETSGQPEDIQTEESDKPEETPEEDEDKEIQKLCEELLALKKELEELKNENE